jgi:hypothetical protein
MLPLLWVSSSAKTPPEDARKVVLMGISRVFEQLVALWISEREKGF